MGYPPRVVRCNINGSTAGGEQLVHSLWMRADGNVVLAGDYLQTITTKVRDEWDRLMLGGTGLPPALRNFLNVGTTYNSVSGYIVDPLGRATDQAEVPFSSGLAGSVGTALPPSVAICVTLHTKQPGRSGRGRLYLGGLGGALTNANGRMGDVPQQQLADAMGGFYTRLRDTPFGGDAYRPVVVSRTKTDSYKIVKVSVGDVFDTMRSRRTSLKETRRASVVDAS